MHWTDIATFAASLFAVTNPLGNSAIYISMTSDMTAAEKRTISLKTGAAVLVILLISVWIGNALLHFFNIEIYGFEMAGGLIIVLISLAMLHASPSAMSRNRSELKEAPPKNRDSIAVVPLAIPIIAGPGAITASIVAAQQYTSVFEHVALSLTAVGISIIITILLLFSGYVARLLGEEGLKIFTRIMGLLLMAIAFDLLISGIRSAFPHLT